MKPRKQIAFISFEYWPKSNATITCLSNIVDLLNNQYEINVITSDQHAIKTKVDISGQHSIIRVGSRLNALLEIDAMNRNNLVGKITRGIHYFFSKTNERNWGKRIDDSVIKKTINDAQAIFCITMPYSNLEKAIHLIGQDLDKNLYAILLDLYADNPTLIEDDQKNNRYLHRIIQEKQWFSRCTKILTTREFANSFLEHHPDISAKMVIIKHPLVYELPKFKLLYSNNVINFVYTGNFYRNIRSSESVISLIHALSKQDSRIKLHVYGTTLTPSSMIKGYGNVLKNDALQAIQSADFLINLENISRTQIPSKIFEYISTGRPIINLFHTEDDLCVGILRDYPLVYNLDIHLIENEDEIKKLCSWIIEVRGRNVDFETIKECYKDNTPEFVAQQIVECLN